MDEDIARAKAYFEKLSSTDSVAIEDATSNLEQLVDNDPIKAIEISFTLLTAKESTDQIRFHAQNLISKCIKPTETLPINVLQYHYKNWDVEKQEILRNSVTHGILLDYEPEVNVACKNFAYTLLIENYGRTWADGIIFLINVYSNAEQEYSLIQQINAANCLNEVFNLIPNIALSPEIYTSLVELCSSIRVFIEAVETQKDKTILLDFAAHLIRICQKDLQNEEQIAEIVDIAKTVIIQFASIEEVNPKIFYRSFNLVFELFKIVYPVFEYIGGPIMSFTFELLEEQIVLPALLDFITGITKFERDIIQRNRQASLRREKSDEECFYVTSAFIGDPLISLFELLKVGATDDLWKIDQNETYVFIESAQVLRQLYYLYTDDVFDTLKQFIENNITSPDPECVHAALFAFSIYNHEKNYHEFKEFIKELFPLIIELTSYDIPAVKGRAFETILFIVTNFHEFVFHNSMGITSVDQLILEVCQREVDTDCRPVLCFCCQILTEMVNMFKDDEGSKSFFESVFNICTTLYENDDNFIDYEIGPFYSILMADLIRCDLPNSSLDYAGMYSAIFEKVITIAAKIEEDVRDPIATTALSNLLSPIRELVAKYHTQFVPEALDNLMGLLIHLLEIHSPAIFSDCIITINRLVIVMQTHVGDYIDQIMEQAVTGFSSNIDDIIYHTAVLTKNVFREIGRLLVERVEPIYKYLFESFDSSISPKARGAVLTAIGTIFSTVPDSVDPIFEAGGDLLTTIIKTVPMYDTKEETLYVYTGIANFIIGFTKFLDSSEYEDIGRDFYYPIKRKLSAIFKVIAEAVEPNDNELDIFLEMLKTLATSPKCSKVINIQLCNNSSQSIIAKALHSNNNNFKIRASIVKSSIDIL